MIFLQFRDIISDKSVWCGERGDFIGPGDGFDKRAILNSDEVVGSQVRARVVPLCIHGNPKEILCRPKDLIPLPCRCQFHNRKQL